MYEKETILSLDLSTTVLGYCVSNYDKELLELNYISLKEKEMLLKALELKKIINSFTEKYKITNFVIEDRLKAFNSGFSNMESILKLAQFNFLCQYFFFELKIPITIINVNTARSLAFDNFHSIARKVKGVKQKEIAFQFVIKELGESYFPSKILKSGKRKGETKFLDEAKDMSDAYILSKAALKLLKI